MTDERLRPADSADDAWIARLTRELDASGPTDLPVCDEPKFPPSLLDELQPSPLDEPVEPAETRS